METIAEYVETDNLRARMAELGVDYGQGFAMGKSQPLERAVAGTRDLRGHCEHVGGDDGAAPIRPADARIDRHPLSRDRGESRPRGRVLPPFCRRKSYTL